MPAKYHIPILSALALWLFLINLGGHELWPPDEPRFAQVSREMMQSGNYLAPHINGEPYKEKPPLFFWLIAAASAPFGDVTELSARIPSALAGLATVLLTYLLARRMYDPTTAFWSGLVLATAQRFWWQARFGQIDMTLTACLTAAMLCLWIWHEERKMRYVVGFYAAVAAGLLAKGPPALVFPLLTAVVFYWGRRSDRRGLHLLIGSAAAVAVALAWLIPARVAIASAESAAARDQIGMDLYRQIIGRFFLGVSHHEPFYYYLINLPADLFPWSLFLPWTLWWVWRHRRGGEPMRFLLSWSVPAVLFFSLSAGKRALYLLPIFPALAILLALSLIALMTEPHPRWRTRTAWVWAAILFGGAAAPFAVLLTPYADAWSNSLAAVTVCGLLCGIHTLAGARRNAAENLPRNVAIHFALLATLLAVVVFPVINHYKSAKTFCEPLRRLSEADADYDLYSFGFSREEYIYYAKHFHTFVPGLPFEVPDLDQQRRAEVNQSISHAVRQVPFETIHDPTPEDIERLHEALESGYAEAGVDQDTRAAHLTAARAAFRDFFGKFASSRPGFMILRQRVWNLILAYYPEAAEHLHIVTYEQVGSRRVVLLANPAAEDLLQAHALPETPESELQPAWRHAEY